MSMMTEAFGWIIGVQKKSIGDLDIAAMETKLRATNRLKEMWNREIKKAETEYRDTVSVESNAKRSPVSRKLAFQRGAIAAKKIKTLTSAVCMLEKMGGVVDQLKTLKQFYADLSETTSLPKGMSVEQMLRQIYAMSDKMSDKKNELEQMIKTMDEASQTISVDETDGKIETIMNELNSLYDDYNTKVAMNDTTAADEIKVKIEIKKAEMDKQLGIAAMA